MRRFNRFKQLTRLLVATVSLSAAAGAVAIDPEADRILRVMGEYLETANEFSFHADISYDAVLSTGEMVRYGGGSDVSVRRPDRLLVAFDGDEYRRRWGPT